MRIAYLANTVVPSHVASSVHIMKMCDAFAEQGHHVTLFLRPRKDLQGVQLAGDPWKFYSLKNRFKIKTVPLAGTFASGYQDVPTYLKYYFRIAGIDLVYARDHGWNYYRVHQLKKPFILESHVLKDTPLLRKMMQSPYFRFLAVISEQLKQDYLELDFEFNGKVGLFRDGADAAGSVEPIMLSRSGRPVCGYIGNLFPGKGVELILAIAKRCSTHEFHVFGGTDESVSSWMQSPEYQDCENVIFHGFVPHAETERIRASCDVLIAPYAASVAGYGDTDGKLNLANWMSPLKIFEYMAVGKPILTSNLPVLREFLEDGKEAILCDPSNVESWVQALAGLAASPSLSSELGMQARETFEKHYTWFARAGALVDEVRRVGYRTPVLSDACVSGRCT